MTHPNQHCHNQDPEQFNISMLFVYLDSPVIIIIDKKEGNSTTTATENGNRAIYFLRP